MKLKTGRALVIAAIAIFSIATPYSFYRISGDVPEHHADGIDVPQLQDSLDKYEVAIGDGHTHTTYSSGTTTVAENVAKAKERGLNWLAITDHKTVAQKAECEAETTDDFLCVVGEEVSTGQGDVLAWDINSAVWWGLNASYTMDHIFENIHKQGGLAVIAHPFAPDPDDYDYFGTYDTFDAIEVYHGYAGFNDVAISTDMDGLALAKWEEYLNNGWRKTAVGDSDCHNASNPPDEGDLFKRWGAIGYPRNVLYVKEFSLRGIKEAVRSGRLYFTDGPELNLTVDDHILGETIYADTPTLLTINVSGVATASTDLNVHRNGTQIYTQSLSAGPFSYSFTYTANADSWFRAEIRDPQLLMGEVDVAFTNPIYFDLTPYEEPPLPPSNLQAYLIGNDVNLTWDPSPSPDVELYSIFRSTTFDGFDFSFPIAQTNSTAWTDKGVGLGNSSTYFYIVRAVDKTRLMDNNANKAAKLAMWYNKGIHLVSIPIALPDTSLPTVLQTLDYNTVWSYNNTDLLDHWKSYNPLKSYNDLTDIDHKMAFWVEVAQDSNITVAGIVPSATDIQLKTGWNLVGYPSFAVKKVLEALSLISYDRIEGYDKTSPPQYLQLLSSDDSMTSRNGYWIKVDSDQIWTITN